MTILNQEEAFHRAIQKSPDDDAVRLKFADWLEEHGDSDQAERIRLHCTPESEQAQVRERLTALCRAEYERIRASVLGITRPVFDRGFLVGAEVWLSNIPEGDILEKGDALFAACPLFDDLNLGMGVRQPDRVRELAQKPFLSRVRHLSFSTCWKQAPGDGGDVILDAILTSPHLTKLHSLCVWRSAVTHSGVERIIHTPALANLEELRLPSNEIGDEGVQRLARSTLRPHTLSLERNGISATGIEELVSSPLAPALQKLNVSRNSFGNRGIQSLTGNRGLNRLTHLRLESVRDEPIIDPETRRRLASQRIIRVGDFPQIQYPEIDPDILRILLGKTALPALSNLDLSSNNIGTEQLRAIAESPGLAKLRSLDLSSNNLSVDDVLTLDRSPFLGDCLVEVTSNFRRGRPIEEIVQLPPRFYVRDNAPIPSHIHADQIALKRSDYF